MNLLNRKLKPEPATDLDYEFPPVENFMLPNGIKVFLLQKNDLPIVRIILSFGAGCSLDPFEKKGISKLTSICIDEGAGEFDALQLEEEFDLLGIQFDIDCDDDSTNFNILSLAENVDRSLYLLILIIKSPHFDEINFAREKNKIITRLIQQKDNADSIANRIFYQKIFGEQSFYAHPTLGYDYTVERISNADLLNFYSSNYSPRNTSIIVVGAISKHELVNHLNNYFSTWEPTALREQKNYIEDIPNPKFYFVNKEGAVQTEIRIGHSIGKLNLEDFFKRIFLNTAFGGYFSSRLNKNLREKNGYTYGISSSNMYLKHSGKISINTSVASEVTQQAVEEIFSEIRKLKNGLSTEEFESVKSYHIKKYPLDFETISSIANRIVFKLNLELPDEYFNMYMSRIKKMTIAKVNSFAEQFLEEEKCKIVLVGDKKSIVNQFKDKELIELDYNGVLVD